MKKKPLFILGNLKDSNKTKRKLIKITRKNKFEQMISEFEQFQQMISKPTRVSEDTSSLIDVTKTNKADIILHNSNAMLLITHS